MAGCQISNCSTSWRPIIMFTCIVNIHTPAFTQTHSIQTISQGSLRKA